MLKVLITKYLLSETGKKIILEVLAILSKSKTNTIDEKLVKAVDAALCNKDYGLQRKPTGPRKAKPVASSKKA